MNIVYPMYGIELSAYNKAVRVSTKTVTIRHRTLAKIDVPSPQIIEILCPSGMLWSHPCPFPLKPKSSSIDRAYAIPFSISGLRQSEMEQFIYNSLALHSANCAE